MARKKNSPEGEMSFLGHLEVLRWHLVRSAIAIGVFALVAFVNKTILFDYLIFYPKNPDFPTYRFFCLLSQWLGIDDTFCMSESPFSLKNIHMAGQFTTHLWASIIMGFVLAFPYVLWEFWRFLKPALKSNERRYAKGIVFFGSLLFLMGVLFGYFLIAPLSVNFLGTYQVSAEVPNEITLTSFISIVTTVTLATGIVFELPVIVYFLAKLGLITPKGMRTYRKHALVAILILSAIITPPDISSQILVSLPLLLLYEISIRVAAMVSKKQENE